MKSLPGTILIIAFMVASVLISIFLPSGALAIGLGWAFVFLISVALLSLFASVLFKGVGQNRDVASILAISIVGIISAIVQFAVLYRWTGFQPSSGVRSESLPDAVYFSVVTWTTLGYGDFVPLQEARYIVVVEAMLGYVVMALLISVFVSVIARHG